VSHEAQTFQADHAGVYELSVLVRGFSGALCVYGPRDSVDIIDVIDTDGQFRYALILAAADLVQVALVGAFADGAEWSARLEMVKRL
jgi:hypothetical protein